MGEYGNDRRFITTTNSSINTTLALARAHHGLHLAPHRSCGALNEPQAVMTTQNYKAKSGFPDPFCSGKSPTQIEPEERVLLVKSKNMGLALRDQNTEQSYVRK